MKGPVWQAWAAAGPTALVLFRAPGRPNMDKSLGQDSLYALGVSFMVAYIASHTLPAGAPYLPVFRVVGSVATLAYGAALVPGVIWFLGS